MKILATIIIKKISLRSQPVKSEIVKTSSNYNLNKPGITVIL